MTPPGIATNGNCCHISCATHETDLSIESSCRAGAYFLPNPLTIGALPLSLREGFAKYRVARSNLLTYLMHSSRSNPNLLLSILARLDGIVELAESSPRWLECICPQ